jgi:L-fuconolactonase
MTLKVDAHQHFWDPSRADYPWMTDKLATIRRPFGAGDLRPRLREHGIEASVLVQTRASVAESFEFLRIAEQTDFVAGVVGWVDLTDPWMDQTLQQIRSSPAGKWLVGIRHQVHDEADPDWLLRPDVRRGLATLETTGLVFDLLVRSRELPAAISTVRDLPGLRFVLDHLAKPPIADGELSPWAELIAELAGLPNVSCKLSGMVTEADWQNWRPEHLTPFVEHVCAVFGSNRLMFGSDWPVCLLAASYSEVYGATRAALGRLSQAELDQVFGGTAAEVYRLPRV